MFRVSCSAVTPVRLSTLPSVLNSGTFCHLKKTFSSCTYILYSHTICLCRPLLDFKGNVRVQYNKNRFIGALHKPNQASSNKKLFIWLPYPNFLTLRIFPQNDVKTTVAVKLGLQWMLIAKFWTIFTILFHHGS